MKLWLGKRRRGDAVGLVATDDTSRAALARIEDGECVQVEIVRPRSVDWNRMYWGMCREIGQHQDPPRDEDSIESEIRILAGHYEVIYVGHTHAPWWLGALTRVLIDRGGIGRWLANRINVRLTKHRVLVPKRIAFDKMDGDQWAEYFKRAELAICERFGDSYITQQHWHAA